MSAATVSSNSGSLLNGLLAWWSNREPSGSARQDTSGNGHTLLEVGGEVEDAPGIDNTSAMATISGTSRLVYDGPVITSSPFTFALWVCPTSFFLGRTAFNQSVTTGKITISETALGAINANVGTGTNLTSSGALTVGVWTHIVVSHDGTNSFLYVDGRIRDTKAQTADLTGTLTTVGAVANGTANWRGGIQMVGVWNRLLTDGGVTEVPGAIVAGTAADGEIARLYNGGLGLNLTRAA